MSTTSISTKQKWDGKFDENAGYEYALVYMISELRLIPIGKWTEVDRKECLEARIFGESGELHLFREDDEIMACEVRDHSDGKGKEYAVIDRIHSIRSNCSREVSGCSGIIIREYIDYDTDGQAYVALTRLAGLV